MPITFEKDNDVIRYALEKIISYPRDNQHIFIAQCVWWLASSIGLQEELVIDIHNLRIRLKAYQPSIATSSYIPGIHPNQIPEISKQFFSKESPRDGETKNLSESKSGLLCTSEDSLYNSVSMNCEKFLQELGLAR
jgi:hypothetical protein